MHQISGYMDLLEHQERRRREPELHPYYQELTKKSILTGGGSPHYNLNVDINYANVNSFEGIDDNSLPEGMDDFLFYYSTGLLQSLYDVIWWVTPEFEYHTKRVIGLPNPIWNEKYSLRFNPFGIQQFLHVEVIRYSSPCDIGSSSGVEVMGRARIPMPTGIDDTFVGEIELVRQDEHGCRPEGNIHLKMEVTME